MLKYCEKHNLLYKKFYKYEIQLLWIKGESDKVLDNLYGNYFQFIPIYWWK